MSVLQSDETQEFENEFSEHCDAHYTVLVGVPFCAPCVSFGNTGALKANIVQCFSHLATRECMRRLKISAQNCSIQQAVRALYIMKQWYRKAEEWRQAHAQTQSDAFACYQLLAQGETEIANLIFSESSFALLMHKTYFPTFMQNVDAYFAKVLVAPQQLCVDKMLSYDCEKTLQRTQKA